MVAARDLLRHAIHESGLSYEHVATVLGVERETVWRWLAGRTLPSLRQAFVIEEHFGVSPRSWVREGEKKSTTECCIRVTDICST